jgi:hypothetical protein
MTVLFGTVEYFEREILNYLEDKESQYDDSDLLESIITQLEDEILHDFVCDEKIRRECLNNLEIARESVVVC